jgi:hypothetical protein
MSIDNWDEVSPQTKALIKAHAAAMDDLPIIERLRFVKNLVCDRRGETGDTETDAILRMVEGIVDGVIEVLKKNPRAAQLRDHGL